ncbi:hypothetical protein FA13DRAFT_1814687 [Coprinellus micaceus]|uniref:PARP catalytic domain-containing protein n=1 Tax=Coprinellus micaceus TaxID=71717 RepID=A0A4Y7T992_COPMI|nr:hypothetical protein FA13DRAFT_1814687 [Coprinellus micaceus]
MASAAYSYPSDVDSDDGYGSDQFSDESDIDDFMGNRTPATRTPPPRYSSTSSLPRYTAAGMCIVCQRKPPYYNPRTGQSYPTCGLTCAAVLSQQAAAPPGRRSGSSSRSGSSGRANGYSHHDPSRRFAASQSGAGVPNTAGYRTPNLGASFPQPKKELCVVCKKGWTHRDYVTCGVTCGEKLCKDGGDSTMCTYCHRKPKQQGQEQCGDACADKAKEACLLCKCRPKNGKKHHLCGNTCKRIAMKSTPMILEAPKGHKTYEMAEEKFKKAWKGGAAVPVIKKIYKIIESEEFLKPYAAYKQKVGNEQFRYHGTKRQCQLGITTTQLCASAACAVCNILKTSFKVSVARGGSFGSGVYSSSASNKAFGYCGAGGAMLLTKVVLGKPYIGPARTAQAGFDCLVYDQDGPGNETVVYTDDAIRPVFLITF